MRNIFLAPLRLAIGWGLSPRLLGLIGITMLVLLRISIGWHFHSEGAAKYRQGDWDAAPFFSNAKGPLADHFRSKVWDYQGKFRRDASLTQWWFGQFVDEAAYYYSFTDQQKQAAADALTHAMENHELILDDYADDLEEYELGLKRLESYKDKPERSGVESLSEQVETVRKENDAKLKPALREFDQLWSSFEAQINGIGLQPYQPHERPAPVPMGKPLGDEGMDTSVINKIVPYFDLTIGWCLILGFFTPVAALAAAFFLGSVFMSQYPPATGPTSSYYQLVECMACLVLAGTGAGRFAGLDFFLQLIIRRSEAKGDKKPAA
ncbi:DoxX family protein [Stieleria varia]|uniref:DoxX family protein n=1 Tax=Stieleria varia TaxID=2528005 RepID=UPI001E301E73|nr:DoxX family protein [Stieleria varia]